MYKLITCRKKLSTLEDAVRGEEVAAAGNIDCSGDEVRPNVERGHGNASFPIRIGNRAQLGKCRQTSQQRDRRDELLQDYS
jgi:hypothetical protein